MVLWRALASELLLDKLASDSNTIVAIKYAVGLNDQIRSDLTNTSGQWQVKESISSMTTLIMAFRKK